MQVEGPETDPPVHDHPLTGPVQSLLHPSVLIKLPSSHTSRPTTQASPQVAVQTESEVPVQVKPVSIPQLEEQPSPFT